MHQASHLPAWLCAPNIQAALWAWLSPSSSSSSSSSPFAAPSSGSSSPRCYIVFQLPPHDAGRTASFARTTQEFFQDVRSLKVKLLRVGPAPPPPRLTAAHLQRLGSGSRTKGCEMAAQRTGMVPRYSQPSYACPKGTDEVGRRVPVRSYLLMIIVSQEASSCWNLPTKYQPSHFS